MHLVHLFDAKNNLTFFPSFLTTIQVRLYFTRCTHSDHQSDQLLSPVSESVSPAHSNNDLLEIDCDEDSSDSDTGSVEWVDHEETLL